MRQIDIEHPEYAAQKATWRKHRDLYGGGERLKANAPAYLERRHKEPHDIYQERLHRVFYENYVGSIIDWYASTLFRREPVLSHGATGPGSAFYSGFAEDCDLRGTGLTEFFRKQFIHALVCGRSHVLVDFPQVDGPVCSRAEEESRGASRAYLVAYGVEELINWNCDARGNYEWVVLRTQRAGRDSVAGEWVEETTWTHYDREQYQVFRERHLPCQEGSVERIAAGRHSMAREGRVPLFTLEVGDGLWLMNKAALLQLEHFNKSNALAHSLSLGLYTMPVVYSEREFNQVMGESYYLQMGPNDRFGWTEPEGRVFEIAAENLKRLKEEIYRVCFLMTQAGGAPAGGAAQSAQSKQRDFAVTQEVLRAYGDTVKGHLKHVLRAIAEARQDEVLIDVSGLDDFDIGDFRTDLEDAERLLAMGLGSRTLRSQVHQRLAHKFLCDVRQEVKDRIAQEIEESLDQTPER